MTGLLDLPVEIHLIISSWLPEASHACLSYTCTYFRAVLEFPPRPSRHEILFFNWEREAKDRERLTCVQCLRLRRFFHFHSGPRSRTLARLYDLDDQGPPTSLRSWICLDCLSGLLVGRHVTWISNEKMTMCPHCRQMVFCEGRDGYGRLVVPQHGGKSRCARHPHRVRFKSRSGLGGYCTGRSRICTQDHDMDQTCCERECWGPDFCNGGHENHSIARDAPVQPPSGPEQVVCRLRARLDRVWPPPSRSDLQLRLHMIGCDYNTISDLISSLDISEPER